MEVYINGIDFNEINIPPKIPLDGKKDGKHILI